MLALAPGGDTLRPTVMVIDIDRYKLVNDALGVAAGDNILIALTRRLRRLLKPQDTLARLSGDQFGLILTVRARSGARSPTLPTPSARRSWCRSISPTARSS